MPWNRVIKVKLKLWCRRLLCWNMQEVRAERRDEERGRDGPQYRLKATGMRSRTGLWRTIMSCQSRNTGIVMKNNQRLASYLHWMFRVNFMLLFAVMCSIFFLWVMIFAGLIVAAGRMDDECVRVGGAPFDSAASAFADAFALSWTTFSTVGYGSTYPALGHENENPTNCLFITFICSLESFMGVLYSGFCGAILFGKVLRIQSHAQVAFSDPIVIRYGSGVQGHDDDDDHIADEEDGPKKIPCPILEFRVVNRLYGEVGGEIMDATLNVVANVDANDMDPNGGESHRSGTSRSNRGNTKKSSTLDSTDDSHSDSGRISASSGIRSTGSKFLATRGFSNLLQHHHPPTMDEDPSAPLVNKRIFCKLMIEANEHPFFKRVWLGRHVLDETSPILLPKVRRQIRRNQGHWPESLNSHEEVRNSLRFNQILVSLNGVSNVSASDVYAQKIYDFVDINVGYEFVNILYKDSDGTLKVDTSLINDVREQYGGGGESLLFGE